MRKRLFLMLFLLPLMVFGQQPEAADFTSSYLSDLKTEMQIKWPRNRILNLVFHGHSVPSGFFKTPLVNSLSAYPNLVLNQVKELYPFACINVIVTAKGGENSVKGAARFESEVLIHKPDVLFIDYGLNDRNVGLEKAYESWDLMIKQAKGLGIKVILLTPSPDQGVNYADSTNTLKKHADQIRRLAAENQVGLADSYQAFEFLYPDKEKLATYMSQVNHPNKMGHELITNEIMKWLKP